MVHHDPRKTVEALRDHLARHDKPVGLLFGAGTSASVNCAPVVLGKKPAYEPLVPAIFQLTQSCQADVGALGSTFKEAWSQAEKECSAPNNVELILSKVRHKIDAAGPSDMLLGLSKTDLLVLEATVGKTITRLANPAESRIPSRLPHDDLAQWIKSRQSAVPIEIFTSNYDLLFERALEARRVGVFDGFVGSFEPFFLADLAEDDDMHGARVRLSKIHGSINWKIVQRADGRRVIRAPEPFEGEMILPSHRKYDESRRQPYLSLLSRLGRKLRVADNLLVVCGYSFSDEHINAVIFEALDQHPRTHVVALMYGSPSMDDALTKHAEQRKNMLVLGRRTAIIGGVHGEWRLTEPVDQRAAPVLDVAFDSDADLGAQASLQGDFVLGDFNKFCRFLASMSTNGGVL